MPNLVCSVTSESGEEAEFPEPVPVGPVIRMDEADLRDCEAQQIDAEAASVACDRAARTSKKIGFI